MKNSYPKSGILRGISSSETPHSPKPSPLKPKSSRRSKSGSENVPPPDPNALPESCFSSPSLAGTTKSSAAKIKSPLPPRPPSSNPNPLKRKLNMESIPEIGVPGASDSGVQVIVRMRPPTKEEEEGEPIVHKLSSNSLIILDHMFTFDSIAGTESTQQDIFQLLGVPLVEHCLAGFNSSIFAYGQTGSGKTFTMWGPPNALAEKNSSNDQQGLTPRVFERLFARINEEQVKHADKQLTYQCRCSFLEIYNEHITDLLDPNQRNLQIREDVKSGVYVENLTEEYVCKMKDLNQLLMKGLANRRTGSTSINAESSRSHSVFTCVVDSRCKSMADGLSSLKTSRINLVDLAGSERQKLTGAAGERLKEAGNINRSLSQLGNLINILAEVSQSGKQRHIPYRDSRLTFLLQESLGGNAKLAMICAISPAQSCKSETFSTLRFAQRAKAIKNNAVVNEITQDDVNVLREQIRQLKEELLRMKSNGIPTDSNGVYSTGWNARRSLNLLRFSLNRPRTLPRVENDSDEEMEIDEEDVERLCVQVGLQSAAIGANNNNFNKLPVQSDSQAIACEEIKDLKVTVSTNIGNGCGNDQGFDEADTNMEDCRLEEMASNQLDKHVIVDDHEMPVVNASVCWDDLNHQGHTAPNDEKHTTHKTNTDSLVGEIAEEAIKKKPLVSLDCELHDGISLEGNPVEAQSSTCLDSKSVAGDSAETSVMDPSSHNPPANSSDSVLPSSLSIVPCLDSKSVCGDSAESSVTDPPSHNPTADSPLPVLPSSVVPCHLSPVLQSPTLSISPKVDDKKSGKSLRISQKDLPEASRLSSEVPKLSLAESLRSSSSTQSIKKSLAPTENLAASLHRGLQIIDTHQQSSALRRSSFRFSFKPAELKPLLSVDKVNVGIQTVPQESERQEDSSAFMCSYCKSRTPQLESKETNDSTELQLVPVDGSQFGEKSKKQVPKAVEKVLAGAIRREMALDELCAKQTTEIAHLNRLVQQYKHERECNAIIEQTREDKICRLEGLMDGVITTEEFMEEEFMSLTNEHKLLKEKYENHPEVLRTNIELKRVQDELDGYRNFFDMGERDVLMEEIQHLRSQLQYYIDSSPMSTRKRSPLLQLTCSTEPIAAPLSTIPESAEESVEEAPLSIIPESAEGSAEEKFELERQCWTEAESKWISLSEELRLELEESRSLAEKRRQGLDSEKKCSEELKEALQMAMQGHARILEQYADLQEKHIAMLARHRMIRDGITDVKRAAAKAGVKGAESKFIDSLAAEISALKVEREKEMRYLRDENRGLQTQLRDTAEAVQAAGELLVRLKEAEEAVVIAQKHAVMAEQKAEIAHQEMDKLKKKHETEINTLNQFLAESRLPKEALCPAYNAADMGKYDRGEESLTDQRWREEFEPFCQVDSEFARWSTGYDRCNI